MREWRFTFSLELPHMMFRRLLICTLSALTLHGCAAREPSAADHTRDSQSATSSQNEDPKALAATRPRSSSAVAKPTPIEVPSARQRFSVPVAGVRSDGGHTLATLVSYLFGPSTSVAVDKSAPMLSDEGIPSTLLNSESYATRYRPAGTRAWRFCLL